MVNNITIATIISYISLILGNVISLMYTPFMLASLGTGEYGLFSLTNTIISYVYLLDMGFSNAVIRYNSKFIADNDNEGRENLNGMFLILYISIAILGAIIGYIIYINLDRIFINGLTTNEIDRIKIMFIIALINLVVAFPLNIFNGIIIAHEKFIYTKILGLFRTVLNPLIMVMVLVMGYKAIGMLVASTIFNIFLGLVNIYYCFIKLKINIKFKKFDKVLLISIFNFSFFIFLGLIAQKIYWSTDQVILGMFVSSTSISIYAIGSQLNGYFKVFSNVINSMFLPKLTKLTAKKSSKEEIMSILLKVSRIQYIIAMFIFIGFLLIGKSFIKIWVGEEYYTSYYIALFIMIPQIISIVQALFATLLEAMNKHRVKAIIYLGVAILNLILTLILVKDFGAIGCALATVFGLFVNAIINNLYYSLKLKLDMKYYWKEILKLFPSTILVIISGVIIVNFININTYLDIAKFIVLFTVCYIVIMWKAGLNDMEKSMFNKILYKIGVKTSISNELR